MASRPINDKQRKVLDWLATGATQDPPEPEMKLSAAALKSRGLVRVRRPAGRWTAELTDLGRYYVEHGGYPPEPKKPDKASSGAMAPKPKERKPAVLAQVPAGPPTLSEAEASTRITKPHPAVRSLMDRPIQPADPRARRRGFLAAHLLVRAAEDAGLTVEGHVQPKKRSSETPYRGEALVTLDAGHKKVVVNIGELQQRIPHVLTQKELDDHKRWGHSWAPRYDYVTTDMLCFRIYGGPGYGSMKLAETPTKPLLRYVDRVIALVRRATTEVLEIEERHRLWKAEREEAAEKARRIAERRDHYEEWESALYEQFEDWDQANRLRAFLAAMEANHGNDARAFLTWAGAFVDQLDPATTLQLPDGDVPDWPHEERLRMGRPQTQPARGW